MVDKDICNFRRISHSYNIICDSCGNSMDTVVLFMPLVLFFKKSSESKLISFFKQS